MQDLDEDRQEKEEYWSGNQIVKKIIFVLDIELTIGDVECCLTQFSIAARSYLFPLGSITGSVINL
jgi:hypothetical protein